MFLLLGPSGCGKDDRAAGGGGIRAAERRLESGRDEDVTALPAHARNAGMVFQSFALSPHMTVAENVAFGLRELRVPKPGIAERVEAALASTRMAASARDTGGRALGRRAAAGRSGPRPGGAPPLPPARRAARQPRRGAPAIDAQGEEIRRICKAFGMTTIYVTHDQKEASAVADRIGVMHRGRVLQVGSPSDICRQPVHARWRRSSVRPTWWKPAWSAPRLARRCSTARSEPWWPPARIRRPRRASGSGFC